MWKRYRFKLILKKLELDNGRKIDKFIIEWTQDVTDEFEELEIIMNWLGPERLLTERISGVQKIGKATFKTGPLVSRDRIRLLDN